MFCPQCGTLAFPSPSGAISCTNYKCRYTGPANLKLKIDGKEVDFSTATSSTKVVSRDYAIGKPRKGVKIDGTCPMCSGNDLRIIREVRDIKWDEDYNSTTVQCESCNHTYEKV